MSPLNTSSQVDLEKDPAVRQPNRNLSASYRIYSDVNKATPKADQWVCSSPFTGLCQLLAFLLRHLKCSGAESGFLSLLLLFHCSSALCSSGPVWVFFNGFHKISF
ncbi:hypothetical protein ATANTOWER_031499 [Ataeniobius toweri]|uniref:Uncharacterized protein n=1 Tax=Ataeniobius toweri TaxID=208326 RepID=A0ABU7BAS1_9TELE|nr:hypothetical protein [Ataeniobius toweri]